jgi:hypothetical protein
MKNDSEIAPLPRKRWSGRFFSVKYLLLRALGIGVLFVLVHLAGLREYTTFITGTTGNPEISWRLSAFYGMTYLTLYMGCVVVAPILILTALLLAVWERTRHGQAQGARALPQTPNPDARQQIIL